ncbi:hypothetical protein ON010_g9816 [Phytophthora cinnamomi]|nr:hypothetical protein ON010_g9816 [Phytophthora cinnamomi]
MPPVLSRRGAYFGGLPVRHHHTRSLVTGIAAIIEPGKSWQTPMETRALSSKKDKFLSYTIPFTTSLGEPIPV